jgi:hypothetical protein
MDEVAENCTKAAVLSRGEVIMCDHPAHLFARFEELLKLGLDIPLTSKISNVLKDDGFIIESDCTAGDFAKKVLEVYGGGQNA